MIDFNDPIQTKKFLLDLNKQVDAYCVKEFTDDPRNHLGASIIGSDCAAYSWGVFRWLKAEPFSGRMLRLFNRGHREEARFVQWLGGANFTVWEVDPNSPIDAKTGEQSQFRISGVKGHFGGSLDCIIFRNDTGHLLGEFKTHNQNSFNDVVKKGVIRSKPKHYRQMCSYGRAYGLTHGLYYAVNKNDDDLHTEIVALDYREADDLFRKAENIILSQTQPQKIAQVETYYECKFCAFSDICFKSAAPDKNCRSCKHAVPTDNAEWGCTKHNVLLPIDLIKVGCKDYERIIN